MSEITTMNTELTEKQAEAYKLHNKILVSGQMAAEYLVDLAKNLRQMRDTKLYTELGFETFEAYCEDAAHIKQRQAYNFIKALDEFGENGLQSNASLGITKLTALATLCADDREQLMQSVDVANISTRELEEKVAELKKKCEQLEIDLEETQSEAKMDRKEQEDANAAAMKYKSLYERQGEEVNRLEKRVSNLEDENKKLKNRPVEVAVAEPTEEQKAALRKEIEAKVKEENSKAVAQAQQEKQEAEKKAKQLEKEIEVLQATAKNSTPSGGTKELLKFHFSNIKTAFNAAAEIISAMEDGEEKAKFKAAIKRLVEECGKAAI